MNVVPFINSLIGAIKPLRKRVTDRERAALVIFEHLSKERGRMLLGYRGKPLPTKLIWREGRIRCLTLRPTKGWRNERLCEWWPAGFERSKLMDFEVIVD